MWQILPNFEVNWLNGQCYLAVSSKMAARIFIFSIVLDAEKLSYMKSIETHARVFLVLIILSISSVILVNWASVILVSILTLEIFCFLGIQTSDRTRANGAAKVSYSHTNWPNIDEESTRAKNPSNATCATRDSPIQGMYYLSKFLVQIKALKTQ